MKDTRQIKCIVISVTSDYRTLKYTSNIDVSMNNGDNNTILLIEIRPQGYKS